MRRTIHERLSRLFVGAAIGIVTVGGCAAMKSPEVWSLQTASEIPAAAGNVKVKTEKGGNTKVEVAVEHLAPAPVAFGSPNYVVWIVPETGAAGEPNIAAQAQNVGLLSVGNDLKGSFKTTTSFKTFEVIVTAEAAPNVTTPGSNRVMTSAVIHLPT
jgi:hypothetical protein